VVDTHTVSRVSRQSAAIRSLLFTDCNTNFATRQCIDTIYITLFVTKYTNISGDEQYSPTSLDHCAEGLQSG